MGPVSDTTERGTARLHRGTDLCAETFELTIHDYWKGRPSTDPDLRADLEPLSALISDWTKVRALRNHEFLIEGNCGDTKVIRSWDTTYRKWQADLITFGETVDECEFDVLIHKYVQLIRIRD